MEKIALQNKLDIEKWLDSETKCKDQCGKYEYCAYCENENDYPCANAYLRMKEAGEAKAAAKKTSAKMKPSAQKESAATKKTGYRTPTFAERLAAADEDVRKIYENFTQLFEGYKGLKSRVSNKCVTFAYKRKPLVRVRLLRKGIQAYFDIDPNEPAFEKYPVRDVSETKSYTDTPFAFRIVSALSVKRSAKLAAFVLRKYGYEPKV